MVVILPSTSLLIVSQYHTTNLLHMPITAMIFITVNFLEGDGTGGKGGVCVRFEVFVVNGDYGDAIRSRKEIYTCIYF